MRGFLKSFSYAFNGFIYAVKSERNLRFHLATAFYVYLFSMFYNFNKIEYAIITILIGSVVAMELLNSAIEQAVDSPSDKHYITAGFAKDIAAGAVLAISLTSLVCGIILFYDLAVLTRILMYFTNNFLCLLLLIASLIMSTLFIFRKEDK